MLLALVFALAPQARAQDGPEPATASQGGEPRLLADLSLEELMDIEVSSSSRSEKELGDVPAAAYVLTGDEIRRAGFTNVQEALRMVPGVYVGNWASSEWDVTARGFTSGFAHQLLVMLDGVPIYSPVIGRVEWMLHEIPIEIIDRVEIIRGPGAALWGNNAVNGVVNIITKPAADSQGIGLNAITGSEDRQYSVRYGGVAGENGHYRLWGLGSDHDPLVDSSGVHWEGEDWWTGRLGFRGDWSLGERDTISVSANLHKSEYSDYWFDSGGSLAGAWDHREESGASQRLVGSYLYEDLDSTNDVTTHALDLDWSRREELSPTNTLTLGVGGRLVTEESSRNDEDWLFPASDDIWTVRAIVLDEIEVPDANLSFHLGTEVEHNSYTGFEIQPTARALWRASATHTFWAAISRAVRMPTVIEHSYQRLFVDDGLGEITGTVANHDLDPEELVAFELGWRVQASDSLAIDVAGFHNDLDQLVTNQILPPFTQDGYTWMVDSTANEGAAKSYGLEIAFDAVLTDSWRARAAYTYYDQLNEFQGASDDYGFAEYDSFAAQHMANLRSYLDLGNHWEFDIGLYYVQHEIESYNRRYVRTDARLGYAPIDGWSFSLGVQNATDPHHPEEPYDSEVPRNIWFGIGWSR